MLPHTFNEAIQKIGDHCNEKKIIDLIISGQLDACFRYDGVIGVYEQFIPCFYSTLNSVQLKEALLDTLEFHDWLKVEKNTAGFHDLLFKKKDYIEIIHSYGERPSIKKQTIFDFILLDEDLELYALVPEVDTPKLYTYKLTFDDLRITNESLQIYLTYTGIQDSSNADLLMKISELEKEIKYLKADLIKGKSKRTCNQLIYALCSYANLDISKPYPAYKILARHCDSQDEIIPIPGDETSAEFFKAAEYEFNNRDPK